MAKFHVPVIVEVECESIDAARQQVYRMIEDKDIVAEQGALVFMGDDSRKINSHQRIVILHPEDTNSEYDPEEYARNKKEGE